jgi:hypothetical protein
VGRREITAGEKLMAQAVAGRRRRRSAVAHQLAP